MQAINEIEARLQKELARRKQDTVNYNKKVDALVKNNEQIREVKEKIDRAYLNKFHALQLNEKQVRDINKQREETELERQLMLRRAEEERERDAREREEMSRRAGYRHMLEAQMENKRSNVNQTLSAKNREKREIEDTINKMMAEERAKIEAEKVKKEQLYAMFNNALEEKNQARLAQKQREEDENKRYLAYVSTKENRENENNKKKAELDEAKNILYEKIKNDQEKRLREQEELEALKEQLLMEEVKEKERKQREADEQRRQQMKEEMLKWEAEDRLFKESKKLEEQRLEQHFKQQMMDEFAKIEKLEQMNQNKKRMKINEHKKEVEKLWDDRRAVFEKQMEEEMAEIDKIRQKRIEEDNFVEEQKRRLVQENLPYIEDFCSKDLYKYVK